MHSWESWFQRGDPFLKANVRPPSTFPLPQSVPHTKLVSRWGGQDGERTKSVHLRRHGVDIGQVAAPYTIMEYVCMSNLYVDIYVRIICMLYV